MVAGWYGLQLDVCSRSATASFVSEPRESALMMLSHAVRYDSLANEAPRLAE